MFLVAYGISSAPSLGFAIWIILLWNYDCCLHDLEIEIGSLLLLSLIDKARKKKKKKKKKEVEE
jgi:hypothetical protein